MISSGAPFTLTSAPRSTVTHVDEGGFTLCGTRIGDEWAGQYDAGIPNGLPTCKRCARRVETLPAACIDAPRPETVPVVREWDGSNVRHAVVRFLSSDSEANYNTVTGDRVTDAYSYGESRTLTGVSGTAVTYCGRQSYGVTYGAGDGPRVDCRECRTFDLGSAAVHAHLISEWDESVKRAEAAEAAAEEEEWAATVKYYRAMGRTFVPTDPTQPRGWGEWVALVDVDHAEALDEDERRTVCALVLANMAEEDARARSMANHPAGKGRTRKILGAHFVGGLPVVRPVHRDPLTGGMVFHCDPLPVP